MRHRIFLPLLLGSVLLSTGCVATHREWEAWRVHSTHYASTNHMTFSLGNMVGGAPRVTRPWAASSSSRAPSSAT